MYSKQKTWQRQLPTVAHSCSSSPLPFRKIREIINAKPIVTYVKDSSAFSYGLSISHNTCKCMLSTCYDRLKRISVHCTSQLSLATNCLTDAMVFACYDWLVCIQCFRAHTARHWIYTYNCVCLCVISILSNQRYVASNNDGSVPNSDTPQSS